MKCYKDWAPSAHDMRGLGLEDRQAWFVAPLIHTRDSDVLEQSNWHAFRCEMERADPEGVDWEEHSFNHWACGWFEIVLLRPDTAAATAAEEIEDRLVNVYPILDEDDHSERELEAAEQIWRDCYDATERIAYIRAHRSQFEFRSFVDLLGCVRGHYFAGYASELVP